MKNIFFVLQTEWGCIAIWRKEDGIIANERTLFNFGTRIDDARAFVENDCPQFDEGQLEMMALNYKPLRIHKREARGVYTIDKTQQVITRK